MAKYSVGNTGTKSNSDYCELCGDGSKDAEEKQIAGATLSVCSSCSPDSDTNTTKTENSSEYTSSDSNMWNRDTTTWETEGTGYESDKLPHLINDYGDVVQNERQEHNLSIDELSTHLGVDTDVMIQIEESNARMTGVSGSVIKELESILDVQLVA